MFALRRAAGHDGLGSVGTAGPSSLHRLAALQKLRGARQQSSSSSFPSSPSAAPSSPSSSSPSSTPKAPGHVKPIYLPPVSFSTAAARSHATKAPEKWAPVPPTTTADEAVAPAVLAADKEHAAVRPPAASAGPKLADLPMPPALSTGTAARTPGSNTTVILAEDGIRPIRILGIESSADDACAAVVSGDRRILSSVVMKQHEINKEYGGIHPIQAQEAHQSDIPLAIRQALKEADLTLDDLDAIAYTRGPGMMGCLGVGATSAKALAAAADKPLVGVHHMQAHALTAMLTEDVPPRFPFLTLLVSGGHTQLLLAENIETYRIIGDKLDNALGDAFDKIARLLQLPPSPTHGLGPVLEDYASRFPLGPYVDQPIEPMRFPLTKPKEMKMVAFSFAGLMTQTERRAKKEFSNLKMKIPEKVKREISRAFQVAAIGHVVQKVRLAIDTLDMPIHGLVVSGGVGSNLYLREQLRVMLDDVLVTNKLDDPIGLYFPPIPLCTDNAAMIAWVAALRLQNGLKSDPFNLPLRRKWSLEDLYNDVPADAYHQK